MNSKFLHKIRLLLFSPESKFELFTRTLYHRIAATKVYFWIQNWLSRRSFRHWLDEQRKQPIPSPESFAHLPKVSFLVDVSQATQKEIKRTLESILAFQSKAWEVFLFSTKPSTARDIRDNLDNARNIFIVNEDVDVLSELSGEFVIFCQAGDQFSNRLLTSFYQLLASDITPDVVSYDSSMYDTSTRSEKPFFKPAQLSPSLLLSLNYLSRSFISVSALRDVLTRVDPEVSFLSQEYCVILRLCEKEAIIHHLPSLLVSQTQWVTPDCQSNQEVVRSHLSNKALNDVSIVTDNDRTQVNWQTKPHSVSIVILTKNNVDLLRDLITSIFSHQYEQEININIIDNNTNEESLPYYEELQENPLIKIIPYKKPFNYSEAINLGAKESDSDLILFLNDDMQIINAGWLSELSQWAMRPEIGVVGAKLIRKNHTIQHAGIIMGLTGFMGHIYLNAPEHYFGLWGSADWYRDILALTGACQMIRRDVFNQVGGYDEKYRLAFGDIDFCIRVHEAGYRNIYNPNAVLYHYEGMSRGYDTPVDDTIYGYNRFEQYLIKNDPYYSPNLTYTRIPRCNQNTESEEDRIRQIEDRRKFYTRSN